MFLRLSSLIVLYTCLVFLSLVSSTALLFADGPKDNIADNVRRIPRLGIEVTAEVREELEAGMKELGQKIGTLKSKKDTFVQNLLPDVQVFERAVRVALQYQEFFTEGDINKARRLLKAGIDRAEQLSFGKAPWTGQTGLVVGGYISKIDGTVQPFGVVVPESYTTEGKNRYRCDLWFHGRGETLSEVNFLDQRMRSVGQYAPADTFVLHPYGRYSNAFKFAGEVDVLEALEAVRERYRIDANRISVRGFSMGGAACWQFAVHYADRWFAANPGAGFSETPKFLKFFQKETLTPTWYEKKLWHMYDCNDWAINLFHCPTVAYSGELDIQKQAADIMETALEKEGVDLVHIIGPQTKHRIHDDSKVEIEERLARLAEVGRQVLPRTIHLATYTLKYNRMHWVTVNALGEHWERATVDARISGYDRLNIETQNVTELTLEFPSGLCPLEITRSVQLIVDGQQVEAPRPKSDRSWHCQLHQKDNQWKVGPPAEESILKKKHDLQGPIDDAFMDSFVIVKPTGESPNRKFSEWASSELDHVVTHWRRHFRGDARVKTDEEISDEDLANSNLILFGDPASNSLLKKIAAKLPLKWTADQIQVGQRQYDSDHHGLIMIYPNPMNPEKYIVLNSGFTFREYDYLNNARQVSKLPDWAIVDLRTPVSSRAPGKIVEADFFGENWELRPARQ